MGTPNGSVKVASPENIMVTVRDPDHINETTRRQTSNKVYNLLNPDKCCIQARYEYIL